MIEAIGAITLAIHDMRRAVGFYRMLGFEMTHGGEDATFTSFKAGNGYLIYESDVDALYARVLAAGYRPQAPPRDAEWGERYFHLTDPDGHELSFAWPLRSPRTPDLTDQSC